MFRIHVVAGLIMNAAEQVFIACRPADRAYPGYWEFPGGKLEQGEIPFEGLKRELHEEIGIVVLSATPLIQIEHDYPERAIILDVWKIEAFEGEPFGREGQQVKWVTVEELKNYTFPSANAEVIQLLSSSVLQMSYPTQ